MRVLFSTIIYLSMVLLFSCKGKPGGSSIASDAESPNLVKKDLIFANNPLKNTILGEPEELVIDLDNGERQMYDDFIESVSFVRLETTRNNLIGEISQILCTDSLLVIADYRVAKAVFVFDREGRYKCRIGRLGRGPGEYGSFENIFIIPEENLIALYESPINKMHYFTYSGEFVRSERYPFDSNFVERLESGYKVFNTGSGLSLTNVNLGEYRNNTLLVTNTNDEIMYSACPSLYEAGKFTFGTLLPIRKFGNNVYYSPNFMNLIYQVGDSCLTVKYKLNIKRGMPPITKEMTNEKFIENAKKYNLFNGDIIELKDLTFLRFAGSNRETLVIYSHNSKKIYYTRGESMNSAFIFFHYANSKGLYEENTIIVDVSSHFVMAYKAPISSKIRNQDLVRELYDGLTEDDNPVIFFYKMKTDL